MNADNTSQLFRGFVRPMRIYAEETTESDEILILIAVQTPVPHRFPEVWTLEKKTTRDDITISKEKTSERLECSFLKKY